MTRLLLKFGAPVMAFLVIFALLMPTLGERFLAHLLVYIVSEGQSYNRQVYMLHLERDLVVSATHQPVADVNPRVSPDGHWLIYQADMNDDRYSLVNLYTWETRVLPEFPPSTLPISVVWFADPERIGFVTYGEDNYMDKRLAYEVDTFSLIEVENFDAYPPPRLPFQPIFLWGAIPLTEDGTETQQVTVDEDGFPRFYDENSGIPPVPYSPSPYEFVSLTPDQKWFVVPITRNTQRDLYRVPVWQGEPIHLTNDNAQESNVVWSVDNRYIAYVAQIGTFREFRVMDMTTYEVITHVSGQTYGQYAVWIP